MAQTHTELSHKVQGIEEKLQLPLTAEVAEEIVQQEAQVKEKTAAANEEPIGRSTKGRGF